MEILVLRVVIPVHVEAKIGGSYIGSDVRDVAILYHWK
jgi:hypothetical protein